jgi:KaiC/GvpD/RAD55 family RecA-like ATPase
MSGVNNSKFVKLTNYIAKAVKTHPFSYVKEHLIKKKWPLEMIDRAYAEVLKHETTSKIQNVANDKKTEILTALNFRTKKTRQELIEEVLSPVRKRHFFDNIREESKESKKETGGGSSLSKKESKDKSDNDIVKEALRLAETVIETQNMNAKLGASPKTKQKNNDSFTSSISEDEKIREEREELEAQRIALEAERERLEAIKNMDQNKPSTTIKKVERKRHEEDKKIDPSLLETKLSLLETRLSNFDDAFEEKKFKKEVLYEEVELSTEPIGDRAQTGIPGLDPIIQGGLRRNTTTLVGGGPGSGKSIFGMQFLINGIERFNEPGIYIVFENTKKTIFSIFEQFKWDLPKYEKEKKLGILLFTPEQMQKTIESGGGTLRDAVDSIHAKRIVIDSISEFLMLFRTEMAQRKAYRDLFTMLAKLKSTSVVVVEQETDPQKHNASILEYRADAVVLLYNERLGDIRQRGLEVFKMRGTKHAGRVFPMKIVDSGVVILSGATK